VEELPENDNNPPAKVPDKKKEASSYSKVLPYKKKKTSVCKCETIVSKGTGNVSQNLQSFEKVEPVLQAEENVVQKSPMIKVIAVEKAAEKVSEISESHQYNEEKQFSKQKCKYTPKNHLFC